MPSFDVVSKLNMMEVDNALLQAQRELTTRFDFRDTGTTLEKNTDGIIMVSNSENRLEAALDVLQTKLVRRGVSLKCIDPQKPIPGGKGTFRQVIKLKEGIDRDNAKILVEAIKASKIRVQAAIHEDTLRVTGKARDDLQAVIQLLKSGEHPIELQFNNFRE
jgi:cyclic-di-GMP-binding protein